MPNGYLLCNGASVNKADYPDLAAALGETGTTFSLPDYRDRVPQGAGTVSPNVGVDPSVPALVGGFRSRMIYSGEGSPLIVAPEDVDNMFRRSDGEDEVYGLGLGEGPLPRQQYQFRADYLNSMYSSDTVQPPAWTCHFLVKC